MHTGRRFSVGVRRDDDAADGSPRNGRELAVLYIDIDYSSGVERLQ
jgi:hypothetical protein